MSITTTLGHHLQSPGSCMLQETFLYQLQDHDLPLQSVSIKHHLLSSSKKSPVDCFLLPETLPPPALLNLLFPPTLTLPHILAIRNAESAYCRSYSLSKSFNHSAAHHPLVRPSSAESRARQHVSHQRFTHQEEKPLQRGLAFIYFSRRKAALGGCVRACVCAFVRTIGKRTLERSCQETVGHLPVWRAVFPFLLY